jgi:light-regulated signal transduction histidine kinase (bacteriophytochrome)
MTGSEFCRQVRGKVDPAFCPVLVVEFAGKVKADEWRAYGADVYLQEPIDAAVLTSTVRSLLKLQSSESEVARLRSELAQVRQEFHLFMSRTKHDLSEPLRAITTFAEMIQDEPEADRLTVDERTYLGFVLHGTDGMRKFLSDATLYAQLVREPSVKISRIPLGAAVSAARHELRRQIQETKAEIEVGDLPVVSGNLIGLQQLMSGLLDNAIRYRRADASPNIAVRAVRQSSEEWQISVRDDGIGIAEQYHETVFAPFQKLHGRELSGNGLGLAICRRIVESHGGKLWLESAVDRGSTFFFTLPSVSDEN